ncbi:hypothetical protein ACPC39_01370 [Streptomyces cellulosae]
MDVERTDGQVPLEIEASVGGVRARARSEGTAGTVRLPADAGRPPHPVPTPVLTPRGSTAPP